MPSTIIAGPQGALALDHDDSGRNTPVLFVHCDCGSRRQWDEARRRLAGRNPTAAFDRRGHGDSEPPRDEGFSQEAVAADIGAVAEALGWSRFVLVGHSGGGSLCFTYAGRNRQRVAGVLLVDPSPDPAALPDGMLEGLKRSLQGDDAEAVIERHYRSIGGDDPAVIERVMSDLRRTPKSTRIGNVETMRTFRPAELALSVPDPALCVIQPEYDIDGAIHRIPPGFEKVVVGGVGHWIHLGAPDRFGEILDAFLEDVDDREPWRTSPAKSEARVS